MRGWGGDPNLRFSLRSDGPGLERDKRGFVGRLSSVDLRCFLGVVTLQRMKSRERWSVRATGRG